MIRVKRPSRWWIKFPTGEFFIVEGIDLKSGRDARKRLREMLGINRLPSNIEVRCLSMRY